MRDQLEKQIDEFFAHDSKRVLALKGRWGVGKTRFWKEYAENRLKQHGFEFWRYRYVSLFGLTSIQQVETQILLSGLDLDAKSEAKEWAKQLRRGAALGTIFLEKLSWANLNPLDVSRLWIRKLIVCIDDFERMGSQLCVKDVMGVVADLRENRECRFVLILNDDELESPEFKTYRDKVIDVEVSLQPSTDENLELIASKNQYFEDLLGAFRLIDLQNMRVMQKAIWNLEPFLPQLLDLESGLLSTFVRHVALLTAFRYESRLDVDMNYLKPGTDPSNVESIMPDRDELRSRLHRWDFVWYDFDEHILNQIIDSRFDKESLDRALEPLNDRERSRKMIDRIHGVWDELYSADFSTNSESLVKGFAAFLDENSESMSWRELDQMINVLRELNVSEETLSRWIDKQIESNVKSFDSVECQNALERTSTMSIQEMLYRQMDEIVSTNSIQSVLSMMHGGERWRSDHMAYLASLAVEDWYEFLKTEKDPELLVKLRTFRCRTPSSADRFLPIAHRNFDAALERLTKDDKLHEIRANKVLGLRFGSAESAE